MCAVQRNGKFWKSFGYRKWLVTLKNVCQSVNDTFPLPILPFLSYGYFLVKMLRMVRNVHLLSKLFARAMACREFATIVFRENWFWNEKEICRPLVTRQYPSCLRRCHKKSTSVNPSPLSVAVLYSCIVRKILVLDLHCYKYKLQIIQELKPNDRLMRRQFRELMLQKIIEDEQFINNLVIYCYGVTLKAKFPLV